MPARSHRHIPTPLEAHAEEAGAAGLPPKPEEMSWRDYLIMLLHIAAELEHSLMVEYLYAAYSLGGPGAAKHDRQVREWRDSILTIAREEMGHLLTVQNALLLIGGPVSFDREDYPWSSPFYPFEFRLEPLSLRSLACYVYAEMPKDLTRRVDLEVRQEVLDLIEPGDAPTVGEIYDRIIELIGDPRRIPESTFDPDSYQYQATWDEWGRNYRPGTHKPYPKNPSVPPPYERKTTVIVARMATRTEALAGLRAIASQGEAEHVRQADKMEDSHFDRFAKIFRAFRKIRERDPSWSPSLPIPENPFAGEPKYAPARTTAITSRTSLEWASLFNIRYRMLLTFLTYMFHVPRETAGPTNGRRASILARIFGEMYNLKAIAGVLVRLPLAGPNNSKRAGPPFQVPYTFTPPLPEANFWRMHLDLLDASSELIEALLNHRRLGAAKTPAGGAHYLQALREADRDARTWIEQILSAPVTAGE